MTRSIHEIAIEIFRDWKKVSPHAKPYLEAMYSLSSIKDQYYADSGISVVTYFLANAAGWRGETAKKIKQELKDMLKEVK